MDLQVKTKLSGPLFDGSAPPQLRRVVQTALEKVVELGEQRLALKFRPQGSTNLEDDRSGIFKSVQQAGKAASTGNYRRNISVRVQDLNMIISDGGVVYGPWLEGVSSRNNSTRFKGYAQFRITGEYLQKQSKGVMTKHIQQFVKRMNA